MIKNVSRTKILPEKVVWGLVCITLLQFWLFSVLVFSFFVINFVFITQVFLFFLCSFLYFFIVWLLIYIYICVLLQISKLSMIPVVCVMEWILHNKQYSREVKMSVFVVMIGVGVCTVTDVKVNPKGFVCACVAVFSTSLQQIVSISFFISLLKSIKCGYVSFHQSCPLSHMLLFGKQYHFRLI